MGTNNACMRHGFQKGKVVADKEYTSVLIGARFTSTMSGEVIVPGSFCCCIVDSRM